MKNNLQMIQGIISVLAILCLVVGWFHLFSEEVNLFLYKNLFYILIGISFLLQAPLLSNKKLVYPMYAAAALCIIGGLLPSNSNFAALTTVGLLAGVIISFAKRSASRQ